LATIGTGRIDSDRRLEATPGDDGMLSSELGGREQLAGGDRCFEPAADHLVG
jgi:hypothetical protein